MTSHLTHTNESSICKDGVILCKRGQKYLAFNNKVVKVDFFARDFFKIKAPDSE